MSFFDSIADAGEWREHPIANTGRAVLCGVSPFLCAGQHAVEGASALTDDAVQAVTNASRNVTDGGGLSSLLGLPSAEDIEQVGNSVSNIMMWVSIIAGILLAIILIGVIVFYVH